MKCKTSDCWVVSNPIAVPDPSHFHVLAIPIDLWWPVWNHGCSCSYLSIIVVRLYHLKGTCIDLYFDWNHECFPFPLLILCSLMTYFAVMVHSRMHVLNSMKWTWSQLIKYSGDCQVHSFFFILCNLYFVIFL